MVKLHVCPKAGELSDKLAKSKLMASIKVEGTRRQAELSADKEVDFDFSGKSGASKRIEIDVMEKKYWCDIKIDQFKDNQIVLGGARTKDKDGDLRYPDGTVVKEDVTIVLSTKVEAHEANPKHKQAVRAQKYLEQYGVQETLKGIIHQLAEECPEDPMQKCFDYFQQLSQGASEQSVHGKTPEKFPLEVSDKAVKTAAAQIADEAIAGAVGE